MVTPAWLKRDGKCEVLDVIYMCPEWLDHYYSVALVAAQHERIEELECLLAEARHEVAVQRARAERWRERAENGVKA